MDMNQCVLIKIVQCPNGPNGKRAGLIRILGLNAKLSGPLLTRLPLNFQTATH